jgi:hypothetical protein
MNAEKKALRAFRLWRKEPLIDRKKLHAEMKRRGIMRQINKVCRFLGLKEPYHA